MSGEDEYQWRTLSHALDDRSSPIRKFFDARFGNTRALTGAYRSSAGPILVDNTPTLPNGSLGTLGTAFDLFARFRLDRHYSPEAAVRFVTKNDALAPHRRSLMQLVIGAHADDQDLRARSAWAIALLTDAYRGGLQALLAGPLREVFLGRVFTADELLELAPNAGVAQILSLDAVAHDHLYPRLATPSLTLGPSFSASTVCPADADLIAGGLLLDFKTRLGQVNKSTNSRADATSSVELYQLLGYLMWDLDDQYGMHSVGLYSARYGHFIAWNVDDFLSTLAGAPVNLADERHHVRSLLGLT